MAGKIYVARVSGIIDLPKGGQAHIQAGITRVREGHPILKGRESIFREIDVHYDVEDARSAPQDAPVPEAVTAPAAEAAKPEPVKAPAARPQRGPRKA